MHAQAVIAQELERHPLVAECVHTRHINGSDNRSQVDHRIGGFQPFSTLDWPGRMAAVIFVKGCPWKCAYCHNRHLMTSKQGAGDLRWSSILGELERRTGFLDAVVFSGGEPLASPHLVQMMHEVKALGYRVGLHTNGADPVKLGVLLHQMPRLVDWVGLDVKATADDYDELTGVAGSGAAMRSSLGVLRGSGVEYELRTTVYPGVFDEARLCQLGGELLAAGEKRWVLQSCRELGSTRDMPRSFGLEVV
ncbi:MAG: anaerobic ribonucleoside-triphosphate reductase activating protein, partial [Coriobacteriia bacterium]|nr:anaerobic ribonucleoside-triphosphate reductase activating protein [Coriobacteriia bacterium]